MESTTKRSSRGRMILVAFLIAAALFAVLNFTVLARYRRDADPRHAAAVQTLAEIDAGVIADPVGFQEQCGAASIARDLPNPPNEPQRPYLEYSGSKITVTFEPQAETPGQYRISFQNDSAHSIAPLDALTAIDCEPRSQSTHAARSSLTHRLANVLTRRLAH